jgi:hypothetical protein
LAVLGIAVGALLLRATAVDRRAGDRGYQRLAVHEFPRIQIWEFRREVHP